jgi:hypothetical protein
MEPIQVPTMNYEKVYACSVCRKPAERSVTWYQKSGEWHEYVHYVKNTCDCWKKKNA